MKNNIFEDYRQAWQDNHDGKTICFISRGTWADPQIAYQGKLLNYYDVWELAQPEDATDDYEPTEEEWLNACIDSLFGYTDCGVEPDEFTSADVMTVTHIITIK